MMSKLTTLLALTLSFTACKKDEAKPAASAPTETTAAPKTADPAPAPAAPKAAANSAISLDAGGADWKGFTLQGPAGATVSDNGASGLVVNFTDNTLVQITPADTFDAKLFKDALKANSKTVTYSSDTAEDLSFVTETDMGGNIFKGYGFSVIVSAGGKKVTCGSSYDDQATADRMKAICKSLAKS